MLLLTWLCLYLSLSKYGTSHTDSRNFLHNFVVWKLESLFDIRTQTRKNVSITEKVMGESGSSPRRGPNPPNDSARIPSDQGSPLECPSVSVEQDIPCGSTHQLRAAMSSLMSFKLIQLMGEEVSAQISESTTSTAWLFALATGQSQKKTRPFKNTSPFAHSEARSLSAPPTPQRRRHPSPTGTDKPVGTWAPSDRIAMVGCPRTSHRPCLLMTTTANAHQSAAYDLMNVRTTRTQHHRKNRGIKKHLKAHTSSTLCRPLCMPTHCMLSHVNLHLYVQCIVLL